MRAAPRLKTVAAAVLAAAAAFAFCSCGGEKTEEQTAGAEAGRRHKIAYVTDGDDGPLFETARDAIELLCSERGAAFFESTSAEFSAEAHREAIVSAAEGGSDVIVLAGYYPSEAALALLAEYPDTVFLALGGESADDGRGEMLYDNFHMIRLKWYDAGYAAGYAAVAEGFSSPAFYAISELELTVNCFAGFAAGASDAAEELGKDGVKIYRCLNNFSLAKDGASPVDAEELFALGADAVFAMGGVYGDACEAAKKVGGRVIPVCCGEDTDGSVTPFSVEYDFSSAAVAALERLFANGGIWSVRDAGTYSFAGLENRGVTVKYADGTVGAAWLEELYGRAASGEIAAHDYEDIMQDGLDGVTVEAVN